MIGKTAEAVFIRNPAQMTSYVEKLLEVCTEFLNGGLWFFKAVRGQITDVTISRY